MMTLDEMISDKSEERLQGGVIATMALLSIGGGMFIGYADGANRDFPTPLKVGGISAIISTGAVGAGVMGSKGNKKHFVPYSLFGAAVNGIGFGVGYAFGYGLSIV